MNVRTNSKPSVNSPERGVVLALALALQRTGLPAHRLEGRVREVADALGLEAEVFAQPTSVSVDFGDGAHMRAVGNGDEDLSRMVALDAVAEDLTRGRTAAEDALARLDEVARRPSPWSPTAVKLAHGVTAGSGAVLFGGGAHEVLVSALTGVVISLLTRTGALFPALASFTAAVVGNALPVDVEVVILSACLVLLPGLTITTGLTELANGHLAAGSARLSKALTVLLQLGVGVALAMALVPPTEASAAPLPEWAEQATIVVGAGSFVVLLQARLRDVFVILLASEAAVLGWDLGASLPPLGPALVGALLVGLVANAQARVRGVPAAVAMVPGILLLVPGSVGFRAVDAFASNDAVAGMNAAFACVQTAAALVSGLLLANALLKARVRS